MYSRSFVTYTGLDPINVPGKETRNFSRRSFHSIRNSFNSALANPGVPEDILIKLTGHSSEAMNQNYTHMVLRLLGTR